MTLWPSSANPWQPEADRWNPSVQPTCPLLLSIIPKKSRPLPSNTFLYCKVAYSLNRAESVEILHLLVSKEGRVLAGFSDAQPLPISWGTPA